MAKALFGLGFIFLVIALAGSVDYTVHKSTENIALPPMGSATGWEPLPIPDVMGLIDVDITADWEGDVYWLGVTSKEEAQTEVVLVAAVCAWRRVSIYYV